MKELLKITVAFFIFCLSFTAGAQENFNSVESLPLSVEMAKAYALDQLVEIEYYISSNSMVGEYRYETLDLDVEKPKVSNEIDKLIENHLIHFEVTRPDIDRVYEYVGLRDKDGETLFFAGASVKPIISEHGVWVIPTAQLTFRLTGHLKLEIEDLVEAKIRFRDDNGYVTGYEWLKVEDNVLSFPNWYAGKPGELVLVDGDGNERHYDLETGSYLEKILRYTKFDSSFEGFRRTYDPVELADISVLSKNSIGISPVVEVTLEPWMAAGKLPVLAYTSEGEIASKIFVHRVREDVENEDFVFDEYEVDSDSHTYIFFEPGKYRVWFGWETFRDQNALPHTPYYYGGNG